MAKSTIDVSKLSIFNQFKQIVNIKRHNPNHEENESELDDIYTNINMFIIPILRPDRVLQTGQVIETHLFEGIFGEVKPLIAVGDIIERSGKSNLYIIGNFDFPPIHKVDLSSVRQ